MTLFESLKLIHVSCAFASITGFSLRIFWMASGNTLLQHRATKVLPHIIDTLLLGSAISLLFVLRLSPLEQPWLWAKVIALVVYIGLGMVALRFGRTRRIRAAAGFLALLTAGYILSVAYSKSPWGFWGMLVLQG